MPISGPTPFDDPEATDRGPGFFDEFAFRGKREVVSRQTLLDSLTALMRTCEGCENVTVIGVDRLDPADSRDGCNWGLTLVLDPAGVTPEVYGLAYAMVINSARETWNLNEASA